MPLNKVVFCGTPEFAVPILGAAHAVLGNRLVAVVTRPDAPVGRGRVMTPSPIKATANNLGVPAITPSTKADLKAAIQAIDPDLIIVVAYGMIFPKSIVDRYFCMNIHGSLLPRYRGASPIHSALLNGDKETGITLIKMDRTMDTGNIIQKSALPIGINDTFLELHDRLAVLSAALCIQFLADFEADSFTMVPQTDDGASYCHKFNSSDFALTEAMSPVEKLNRIRAFSPTPGAYVIRHGKRIKIIKATLKDGTLIPLIVRPEGKGDMTYSAITHGEI